jgi:hypothetical protein
MSAPTGRRRAGLLIPLFSCPSTASWGIGDIGDVGPVTEWLASAGQRVFQLLPLNEMAPGQQSPYSAISAMAIDPIYIRVPGVPEFEALGGEAGLSPGDREALSDVRCAKRIDHRTVRRLRIRRCAPRSTLPEAEWRRDSARELRSYVSERAWWVEDYSLFRALHVREHERPWTEWPVELQRREPAAINRARRELADEVVFHQYLQWLAGTQWQHAREHTHGVALFGDLPFMVDGDSADVWARQQQFRLDVSVGAPPDAFSATGQDWGMPLYRWDVMGLEDFRWLRERARRSADVFHGYRVDHLVGFYRTYGKLKDGGEGFFTRRTSRHSSRSASACWSCFAAPAPRSSPKISAPFRTSSAPPRTSVFPATARVPVGAPLLYPGQPFRDPSGIRPCPSRRRARTTTSRSRLVGTREGRRRAAGQRAPLISSSPADRIRGAYWPSCATSCSKRCSRRAPTCSCCRYRTRSAGAIAQQARDRQRRELDLPPALAGGHTR